MNKLWHTLPLLCIVLMSAGCKKSTTSTGTSSSGSYYMKFKADGVQKEFLQNTSGSFNRQQTNNTANYASTFGGTLDPSMVTKNNMTIALVTVGPAKLNQLYTNYKTTAAGMLKAFIVQPGYYDENGVFWLSWSDDFIPAIPPGTTTSAGVTVTAAGSSGIRGTFSGVLYNSDFSKKLIITEGDFFLKMQ